MSDSRWILTAALIVHLSFSVATAYGRDDYEASAFLERFRRQFRERRPPPSPTRDETGDDGIEYRGLTAATDDDDDDDDEDEGYGHGSPWMASEGLGRLDRRYPAGEAEARDDDEYAAADDVNGPSESVNAKTAVGRQRGFEYEYETPVQRSPDAEAASSAMDYDAPFKVETRARARQLPYSDRVSTDDHRRVETSASSPASDAYFIAVVAGCSAAAIFGVMAAGFCWYKFQKNAKAAAEAEYPAYGVTGPNREHVSPSNGGDRKLAQNAQMYHYQHQKQQMIAMEKNSGDRQVSTSDLDSEEENEEGDYTVYECPGLAPTGEMEVKNPLFQDDPTPASPPIPGRTPLNSGTSEESSK